MIPSCWLVLDKPLGISSNQALSKVKRILGLKKAGYSGTLDPLASGVLPIALGEALKTMHYMTLREKTYVFQVRFGVSTTTDDLEGESVEESEVRPSIPAIEAALVTFMGELSQVPPVYSALKIQGKRACDRVRKGEEVILSPRTVTIHEFSLLSLDDADHATFSVRCSSGTYVRSLARDLAIFLGTVGCVSLLRRAHVGPFTLDNALTLEELVKKVVEKEGEMGHIMSTRVPTLPIDIGLDDILAVSVSTDVAHKLICGQRVPMDLDLKATGQTLRLYENQIFIGFARYEEGLRGGVIHPLRMINVND